MKTFLELKSHPVRTKEMQVIRMKQYIGASEVGAKLVWDVQLPEPANCLDPTITFVL